MSIDWYRADQGRLRLTVQVMPNAKRTEVVGEVDGVLKIRLHAQPVEGKANEALVRYVADVLDIPKTTISVIHGHAARRKVIEIVATRLDRADVRRRFGLPDAD